MYGMASGRVERLAAGKIELGAEDDSRIKLPLTSIVINNYNYAAYIGACIDSIKAQDYPRLEVVVVDNASTDNSLEAIDRHIDGDPRFEVIRNKKNDGPMGAFLIGLDTTSGEFLCSVDSDDFMFPYFISTHIQAHLALPQSVAYTSSGVVEVGPDGSLLSAGRAHVIAPRPNYKRGLYPANIAPRISTVSDADYEHLSNAVLTIPLSAPPIWYPGSVNVFRRAALMAYRPAPNDPLTTIAPDGYFMAIDGHFTLTCHLLGASARIETPLSAYRIHGRNVSSAMPTLGGFRLKAGPARRWVPRRRIDRIRIILERAAETEENLAEGRFWQMLTLASGTRGAIVRVPEARPVFIELFRALVSVFGLQQTMTELRKLLGPKNLLLILWRAYDGRPPPRACWLFMRFTISALRRRFGR